MTADSWGEPMRRLLAAPTALAACAVLLSACGGGDDQTSTPPPTIASSPSAQASSAAPSASPSALPTGTAQAVKLHTSVLGRNAADTAQEKAAVDAWMGYWQAVSDTYFDVRASSGLDSTARQQALTDVLDYLAKLKVREEHVGGWARDNVLDVRVSGSTALIRDCTENHSFTADRRDRPTEDPVPFFALTGVVQRQAGAWHVLRVSSQDRQKSCLGGL